MKIVYTMSEAELNAYLLGKRTRDIDLPTLKERLEEKLEEWFYEVAVPQGECGEDDDEFYVSFGTLHAVEFFHRCRQFASLSEHERHNRTREWWHRRMERAKASFPKTYENNEKLFREMYKLFD